MWYFAPDGRVVPARSSNVIDSPTSLRTNHRPHFCTYNNLSTRCPAFFPDGLTLENETDRLFRNGGTQLPTTPSNMPEERRPNSTSIIQLSLFSIHFRINLPSKSRSYSYLSPSIPPSNASHTHPIGEKDTFASLFNQSQ